MTNWPLLRPLMSLFILASTAFSQLLFSPFVLDLIKVMMTKKEEEKIITAEA